MTFFPLDFLIWYIIIDTQTLPPSKAQTFDEFFKIFVLFNNYVCSTLVYVNFLLKYIEVNDPLALSINECFGD